MQMEEVGQMRSTHGIVQLFIGGGTGGGRGPVMMDEMEGMGSKQHLKLTNN